MPLIGSLDQELCTAVTVQSRAGGGGVAASRSKERVLGLGHSREALTEGVECGLDIRFGMGQGGKPSLKG